MLPLINTKSRQHEQAEKAKLLHSQLHLAILQTFLAAGSDKGNLQEELEPGEVEDDADMQHLIRGDELTDLATDMLDLIGSVKNDITTDSDLVNDQIQLALDRFAQIIQVAIATGCLSCRKGVIMSSCNNCYNYYNYCDVFMQ